MSFSNKLNNSWIKLRFFDSRRFFLRRRSSAAAQVWRWALLMTLGLNGSTLEFARAEGRFFPEAALVLPSTLSATGLYQSIQRKSLAPGVRAYEPQYPLWTDGAVKNRFLFLPAGTKIDTSNMDEWIFPVGTKIWKEFVFELPQGEDSNDGSSPRSKRRVETRYLVKTTGGWQAATYLWNEQETQAERAPVQGVSQYFPIPNSNLAHRIPSRSQCWQCHNGALDKVLGFGALALSDLRDPPPPFSGGVSGSQAGDAQMPDSWAATRAPLKDGWTLRSLMEANRLTHPPKQLPQIASPKVLTRQAVGYLVANCAHCHHENPGSNAHFTKLFLNYRVVGTTGEIQFPVFKSGLGHDIVPGVPEKSEIYLEMASGKMPLIGHELVDPTGLRLMEEWIRTLEPPK